MAAFATRAARMIVPLPLFCALLTLLECSTWAKGVRRQRSPVAQTERPRDALALERAVLCAVSTPVHDLPDAARELSHLGSGSEQ